MTNISSSTLPAAASSSTLPAAAPQRETRIVDAVTLVCCICHEQRKDTALNCGHLLCGGCAG